MTTKGTTTRKVRIDDEIWQAASAAFPAPRGTEGGVSAELRSFATFLAEHPDVWIAVKARAAADGVNPWRLVADAVAEYAS